MNNKNYIFIALFAITGFAIFNEFNNKKILTLNSDQNDKSEFEGLYAFELMRLADPATGKIPEYIRQRELDFIQRMQSESNLRGSDSLLLEFEHIGPRNCGGRTRAFAIDKTNSNVYLAGGVSGGMWRSEDAGATWTRVTPMSFQSATSCVSQDPRTGKTSNWYYGSGEVTGNSASKSYSAFFRGSGIYKSTDGGITWKHLESTSAAPQKPSDWDAVFRVLVDPVRNDSDIIYAATKKGIMRSNNGGVSWKRILGSGITASYTDISISKSGKIYAALSSDAGTLTKGFWRSNDGLNWSNITPSGFPSNHDRTLMAIYPGNENLVWYFSYTPNSGTINNSLWLYNYINGDGTGSGGLWFNRSTGLPNHDLSTQGSYSQALSVKPDDYNMVFVGGTNLIRSSNGFLDTTTTRWIGGYKLDWDSNYNYTKGIHYPDQQGMYFDPNDPDLLISTNDAGVFRAKNSGDSILAWENLNIGYVTSQFYGIGIDHGTPGSDEVMGGLQDRGTHWIKNGAPDWLYFHARGADGAYVAIEDGGEVQYSSTQYANIARTSIQTDGSYDKWRTVMPHGWPKGSGSGYLFVHPFTLDPTDNHTMYLPRYGQLWRNDSLYGADSLVRTKWQQVAAVTGTITSVSASESKHGVVYFGTSTKNLYRIDSAHTSNPLVYLISDSITNGGYTSCIAIDPEDEMHVIVVFSNYNIISLWESLDGGRHWRSIEGNLAGETDENVPPMFYYIGNGPSMRWAKIVNTQQGQIVFLGTSVGLFSSRFIDGENTEWVQEGEESIGNVVVDMLDYRSSDRWLVVGTHGNGIFSASIDFTPPAGIERKINLERQIHVYPNPANQSININRELDGVGELNIFSMDGKLKFSFNDFNGNKLLDTYSLPNGFYYAVVKSRKEKDVQKFIVQH